MTAQERFDRLVSEYLDEALGDEGLAELGTLVATQPAYAARFVRLSRLHAELRLLLGPPLRPAGPGIRTAWPVWIAILGAVLLLVALLLGRRSGAP
ncbi:MAG TPA: hypothetical protein VEN81_11145 [Planctomycetota bacterium]|jgi:hypothetical protein|nr:hypothetical protein [Planctomycetota bacterium]